MEEEIPKNKPLYSSFIEAMIGGWTGAILGWAIADGIFDARFFTYFTYALGFAFYLFMFFSETDSSLHKWMVILIFPIYTCLTVFVYVAIVVIVYKNDWVIIRDSVFAGGALSIGEIHTGDWMFHYLPPFMLLVYILVNYVSIAKFNYRMWSSNTTGFSIAYSLYVIVFPALILGCYMITMPFDKNYPTKMRTWQICLLVFGLSTSIQLLYLTGSYSVANTIGKHLYKHSKDKTN